VVLTAQQLYTAASLLEMAEVLAAERTPVAFGGLVFSETPGLHLAIPGYYLGERLERAAETIEQIMAALRVQPAQRTVSYAYREALEHFRARRSLIDADVWQEMEPHVERRHLAVANLSFGRNIMAALTLGDMNYLHPDMAWIEGLLVNHFEMPPIALHGYLESYYRALLAHLDPRGRLVIEWMARLLGTEEPTTAPQ
jgi:hypothetical protein